MDALEKFGKHFPQKMRVFLSAAPLATLELPPCPPNFLSASITRYTHVRHEPTSSLLIELYFRHVLFLGLKVRTHFHRNILQDKIFVVALVLNLEFLRYSWTL